MFQNSKHYFCLCENNTNYSSSSHVFLKIYKKKSHLWYLCFKKNVIQIPTLVCDVELILEAYCLTTFPYIFDDILWEGIMISIHDLISFSPLTATRLSTWFKKKSCLITSWDDTPYYTVNFANKMGFQMWCVRKLCSFVSLLRHLIRNAPH